LMVTNSTLCWSNFQLSMQFSRFGWQHHPIRPSRCST
jgi:hypothetical protein